MALEILTFTLGPLGNNTYLLADPLSRSAVVVDPGYEAHAVVHTIEERGWNLAAAWITHAHFDHTGGLPEILPTAPSHLSIALHPLDLPIWQAGGGARLFGFQHHPLPAPDIFLQHGQQLTIGEEVIEVRHTPGHSAGHVVFWIPSAQAALCGDVIFFHSIGRTDLPGGSQAQLARSIREQIYTLPPAARLLPGHGPETTVGEEIAHNPYVRP